MVSLRSGVNVFEQRARIRHGAFVGKLHGRIDFSGDLVVHGLGGLGGENVLLRQALLQQAQAHEEEKQTAVAIALERADALRERVVAEEREIALKERKKALAVERDTQQKDKYRALAEERERAKLALARVEALDQERQREEQTKLALERAARTERATCRSLHGGVLSSLHMPRLLMTGSMQHAPLGPACPHPILPHSPHDAGQQA